MTKNEFLALLADCIAAHIYWVTNRANSESPWEYRAITSWQEVCDEVDKLYDQI